MKIYTRKGDDGTTTIIGGKRVPKFDNRIEAYGTVDELIAFTGLLRDQKIRKEIEESLIIIQDRLMTCASLLATDHTKSKTSLPVIIEENIIQLEKEIDKMEEKLPVLKSFLLPGGHTTVSYCHVCRCICRRAERLVALVFSDFNPYPLVPKFLNRLSDYYFVLARKMAQDLNVNEIPWIPKLEK